MFENEQLSPEEQALFRACAETALAARLTCGNIGQRPALLRFLQAKQVLFTAAAEKSAEPSIPRADAPPTPGGLGRVARGLGDLLACIDLHESTWKRFTRINIACEEQKDTLVKYIEQAIRCIFYDASWVERREQVLAVFREGTPDA